MSFVTSKAYLAYQAELNRRWYALLLATVPR
jgi:hypothetical protein